MYLDSIPFFRLKEKALAGHAIAVVVVVVLVIDCTGLNIPKEITNLSFLVIKL